MMSVDEITPLIEEKLDALGFELFSLKYSGAKGTSILKICIDSDKGVTVGDCQKATREISMILDVEEFSSSPYNLEVSSPGADRPLKTEKDFKRSMNRMVTVSVLKPDEKIENFTGKIVKCEDGKVFIESSKDLFEILVSDIMHAKIEFSFK